MTSTVAALLRNGVTAIAETSMRASAPQTGNTAATDVSHPAISSVPPVVCKASLTGISEALQTTRSEEHTSELQSLMRISYAVFCLKKKKKRQQRQQTKNRKSTKLHRKTTMKKTEANK